MGRKQEALREAKRAVEMLAVSKDAVDGLELVDNLATGRCAKGVPAGVSPKNALPVVIIALFVRYGAL